MNNKNNKNRTAETLTSFGGIDKKSNSNEDNTNPLSGQVLFHCLGCEQFVDRFTVLIVWKRNNGCSPISYQLCAKCEKSISILPPSLATKFAEKCERNIEAALGVKNG